MKDPALPNLSQLGTLEILKLGYQAGKCNDHTALDFLLSTHRSDRESIKRTNQRSLLKGPKGSIKNGSDHPPLPLLRSHSKKANPLSFREREVLHWIAQGKSNWEISLILSVSENTTKFHIKNLFRNFGVKNRYHLVAKAYGFNGSF